MRSQFAPGKRYPLLSNKQVEEPASRETPKNFWAECGMNPVIIVYVHITTIVLPITEPLCKQYF